ncbi:hypothetical protein, partial [Actinoplanes philippinensis]|uniref:hypothetical protein n=1 Tax=Actinoplanes philippinensis TaxID=35752 RepID=UPI00347A7A31
GARGADQGAGDRAEHADDGHLAHEHGNDTGSGYFDTSGIGLSVGGNDVIHSNTITDDQTEPTTWYGVHLGARKTTTRPAPGRSGTKVSHYTAAGAVGGSSLQVTALKDGQISTAGSPVTAVAGTSYTAVASFQALGAGRQVRAGLAFTDAAGKVTRLGSANVATVDSASGWMTSTCTASAPAGAVTVQPYLMVEKSLTGESHLIDRIGLTTTAATEGWTAPAGLAGAYQVVAYRAGTADLSAVTEIRLP